jgi:aldose 1-epimerase
MSDSLAPHIASKNTLKTVTLTCDGSSLVLLNFGATTVDWRVLSKGHATPMILGFQDVNDYLSAPGYLGAIAGRVSNRIGNGHLKVAGRSYQLGQNEGTTTLHGGPKGLSHVFWELDKLSDSEALLRYHSPAGENGFPGTADIKLRVTLTAKTLRYDLSAEVDQATPVSLAQHNYYNFGTTGTIWDYQVKVASHRTLAQNDLNVSTGEVIDHADGAMDFRKAKPFREIESRGLDDHFLFDRAGSGLCEVAEVRAPSGLGVKFHSDQLGAQIYTAHAMGPIHGGLSGARYGAASGFCFEPQGHPNAVNIPEFPSVIAHPETGYSQQLLIEAVGTDP